MLKPFFLRNKNKEQVSFHFRSVLHQILHMQVHAQSEGSYAPKHAWIVLKFCLKQKKYDGSPGLKFE